MGRTLSGRRELGLLGFGCVVKPTLGRRLYNLQRKGDAVRVRYTNQSDQEKKKKIEEEASLTRAWSRDSPENTDRSIALDCNLSSLSLL